MARMFLGIFCVFLAVSDAVNASRPYGRNSRPRYKMRISDEWDVMHKNDIPLSFRYHDTFPGYQDSLSSKNWRILQYENTVRNILNNNNDRSLYKPPTYEKQENSPTDYLNYPTNLEPKNLNLFVPQPPKPVNNENPISSFTPEVTSNVPTDVSKNDEELEENVHGNDENPNDYQSIQQENISTIFHNSENPETTNGSTESNPKDANTDTVTVKIASSDTDLQSTGESISSTMIQESHSTSYISSEETTVPEKTTEVSKDTSSNSPTTRISLPKITSVSDSNSVQNQTKEDSKDIESTVHQETAASEVIPEVTDNLNSSPTETPITNTASNSIKSEGTEDSNDTQSTTDVETPITITASNSIEDYSTKDSKDGTSMVTKSTGVSSSTTMDDKVKSTENSISTTSVSHTISKSDYTQKQHTTSDNSVEVKTLPDLYELDHVVKISSIRTVKIVVSAVFLVIAFVATAVLTIYMIKVKRNEVQYDQITLLP